MKEYKKAEMIAKNLPTGSYAAGCPEKERGNATTQGETRSCINCERTL